MYKKILYFCCLYFLLLGVNEIKSEAANSDEEPNKINVLRSDICKKCICDAQNKVLNCTYQGMNTVFSQDEWITLLAGDIKFDVIRLQHNNITKIDALPEYPVKQLYFGFNQITTIAKDAFRNLTELTKLDLSHNKLTSKALSPDVFEGAYSTSEYEPLKKLIELDLGYNELHNLDQDLFEHLPNLEALFLCQNTFKIIDHLTNIALSSLRSLKTLDLSYMSLKELPETLFHGPRDLETLILSGNLFTELPDNLVLAVNLKELVLDENPIENITYDNVFPKLEKLEYLSISYLNQLKIVGKGAFSNLPNLKTLVMANNPQLEFIHHAAFARKTVNALIFDYPPLEKLYLHNNNLTTLDNALLERWDKIKIIDLRFNPWICECQNKWLIKTLLLQINDTTPAFARDVFCATPFAWRNMKLLDVTQKNKILICENENHPEDDRSVLIVALVSIIIAVPLALCALVLYQKKCFGVCKSRIMIRDTAIYNRASFNDDYYGK